MCRSTWPTPSLGQRRYATQPGRRRSTVRKSTHAIELLVKKASLDEGVLFEKGAWDRTPLLDPSGFNWIFRILTASFVRKIIYVHHSGSLLFFVQKEREKGNNIVEHRVSSSTLSCCVARILFASLENEPSEWKLCCLSVRKKQYACWTVETSHSDW